MSKRKAGKQVDAMDEGEYESAEERPAKKAKRLTNAQIGAERFRLQREFAKREGYGKFSEIPEDVRLSLNKEIQRIIGLGAPKPKKVPTKQHKKRATVAGRKPRMTKKGTERKNVSSVFTTVNKKMPKTLKKAARAKTTKELDDNLGVAMSASQAQDYFNTKWGNNTIIVKRKGDNGRFYEHEQVASLSTKAARLVKNRRDEGRAIIDMAMMIAMAAGTNKVREVHMVVAVANWNKVESYCATGAGVLRVVINKDVLVPEKTARFPAFKKVIQAVN
jgi:hypothetical protein